MGDHLIKGTVCRNSILALSPCYFKTSHGQTEKANLTFTKYIFSNYIAERHIFNSKRNYLWRHQCARTYECTEQCRRKHKKAIIAEMNIQLKINIRLDCGNQLYMQALSDNLLSTPLLITKYVLFFPVSVAGGHDSFLFQLTTVQCAVYSPLFMCCY